MFLEWDIDPDTQDVKDVLKNMIEVCLGEDSEEVNEPDEQDVKPQLDQQPGSEIVYVD